MSGLLNFLQGASNAAASNVSAPVDGLAWLLKKAGVNVGTPVGGSDWMRQQGLTAEAPGLGGLLGESVGGVLPMVAAAKAPQIAAGLLKVGENAAARPMLNPQTGAIVWHGSPHKFDKFDSSKIGTGEGAQAYGHGLYLAESPDVAKSYQAALSRPDSVGLSKADDIAAWAHSTGGGDKAESVRVLTDEIARLDSYGKFGKKLSRDDYVQALDILNGGKAKAGGALYKVDLPDEKIARMLDWDKPLSQQPAVAPMLDALQAAPELPAGFGQAIAAARTRKHFDGNDLFAELVKVMPNAQASEVMKRAGFPGIRYLDGGSRGAGAGSSNFVVFPGEEGALKILERNGGLLK